MVDEYTFFLNFMGPISNSWYEENNIPFTTEKRYSNIQGKEVEYKEWDVHYYGGRIDIHHPNFAYNNEYGVDVMDGESWGLLSDWLDELSLAELPTKDELFQMFEEQTGHKIKYFKM
jgi:hypothetical protein